MRPDGVSLVEILVALGLLLVVSVVGLGAYERSRRSSQIRGARIGEQQALRAARATLIRELRLAGFNVDPDGDPARTDEPLEAAYATALVFRADLDFGTARDDTPERELGGGIYGTATTGNDEIVGYVLARGDGSSTESFRFEADVLGVPRDGVRESVTVGDVAMTHDAPPYTLYRWTLGHDSTSGRRTPVVDNVGALRFVYYDRTGAIVAPPGGDDDAAGRTVRRSIHHVRVDLESHAGGADSISLGGVVAPPNLGLRGIADAPD